MLVKLTINVSDELRRKARAVAAVRGETVSDVLRAALEEYVASNGRPQPKEAREEPWEGEWLAGLIGIAEGGPDDLSSDKYRHFTE